MRDVLFLKIVQSLVAATWNGSFRTTPMEFEHALDFVIQRSCVYIMRIKSFDLYFHLHIIQSQLLFTIVILQ